jgi:hypothetical protein
VYPQSSIGLKAGLLILREISGAGYFGATILICGIVFGIWSLGKRERVFWLLYLLIPIACALAADIVLVYFLAIRQMIFVLAPMAIVFAAGVEHLLERRAMLGALLVAALVGATLYEDVRLFLRPRENWEAAARILAQSNGCVLFAPEESARLYAYFVPQLRSKSCVGSESAAIAVSPYGGATGDDYAAFQGMVRDSGLVKVADLNPEGPRVELYRKIGENR